MLICYMLYIGGMLLQQLNSVWLYKKYQLEAGTGVQAVVVYMAINGGISALVSWLAIWWSGGTLEITPYSAGMAFLVMANAAVNLVCMLWAYKEGQIATANIIATIGGILLTCIWGVLFLGEGISVREMAAMLIMAAAVAFIMERDREKMDKRLFWLYLILVITASCATMLNKQHQIETRYETAEPLSFCVWVGVARAAVFLSAVPFLKWKKGTPPTEKSTVSEPAGIKHAAVGQVAVGYAIASAALGGIGYILTLLKLSVLPVVVISPLNVGIGIVMSTLFPWAVYRERLGKRQIAGVALSLAGSLLFLWDAG